MASICCIFCQEDHIQHNTKKRHNEKTIMKTTRGDETNDVVNMNNVKSVIVGDKGFMALPFNTTKGDTIMKKLEKTDDVWMKNVKQRRRYNQTWWINHVDCTHGEKTGEKCVYITHHQQHKQDYDNV